MDYEALCIHLDKFFDEFGIVPTPEARREKLVEEVEEFLLADEFSTIEHADDEAIDVLICAISNVRARGIKSPLMECYKKLERTAEKYRNEGLHK